MVRSQADGYLRGPDGSVRRASIQPSGDRSASPAATDGPGPLNFSFDLRRVWSADGKSPDFLVLQFASRCSNGPAKRGGARERILLLRPPAAWACASGPDISPWSAATRKDRELPSPDYTSGRHQLALVSREGGLQIVFEASAQKTRTRPAPLSPARSDPPMRRAPVHLEHGRAQLPEGRRRHPAIPCKSRSRAPSRPDIPSNGHGRGRHHLRGRRGPDIAFRRFAAAPSPLSAALGAR